MYLLVDPVTGFRIPDDWILRSSVADVEDKIKSGLWVILSDGRVLRRGFTTGTTAAAACKGAVLSLQREVRDVDVWTPAGIVVRLKVEAADGICVAEKDAGDHERDVTDGVKIVARARQSDGLRIIAGEGIGRIRRRGLSSDPGKAAISRSAYMQIMRAIGDGVSELGLAGAEVHLSVPEGEKVALQTLNPSVGVEGGISILGSTGFVEPWNEHLGESVATALKTADRVVATTGRTGLRFSRMLFPDHTALLIGSRLDLLKIRNGKTVLCGLPGLILRWAVPDMLDGTGYATVSEMIEHEPEHDAIERAMVRLKQMLPGTRIVLIRRDGSIYRDTGEEV